jgi:hypothetical protein
MPVTHARRTAAFLAMLAAAVLPHFAAPPPEALAGPRLPFDQMADQWVDHAHRQMLVSGGPGSNAIQVVDYEGRLTGRVADLPGASDLLVDGADVYVALADAAEIAVVERKSLTVTDRISVAPFSSPRYLSKSGDTIYFSHSCDEDGSKGFASVDVETGVVLPHQRPNAAADQCAEHAVIPADPSTLLVWDEAGSPLRRYDVSARHPVLEGESEEGRSYDQLAFSGDGETFFSLSWADASFIDGRVSRRRLDDYSAIRVYQGSGVAFALSPNELHLFTGDVLGISVRVYRTHERTARATTPLPDDAYMRQIGAGGLGVTAEADRALIVTGGIAHAEVVWPVYPEVTGPPDQSIPVSGSGWVVWSQRQEGARHHTLLARRGRRTVRITRPGVSGYGGGNTDGKLVYQVVSGRSSDLRLYGLARGRQVSSLGRLNTRMWEWRPTISGGKILFSRAGGGREKIVVHTLGTGRERVLADVPQRTQQAVAGQVNGSWAVWSQCRSACTVYRVNLASGGRVTIPGPKGRLDYAPAVTRSGVVYFARSGVGCGNDVSLLRYSGGRITEIWDLPYGEDIYSIYAEPYATSVYFDRVRCSNDAWDVLRLRDVVR